MSLCRFHIWSSGVMSLWSEEVPWLFSPSLLCSQKNALVLSGRLWSLWPASSTCQEHTSRSLSDVLEALSLGLAWGAVSPIPSRRRVFVLQQSFPPDKPSIILKSLLSWVFSILDLDEDFHYLEFSLKMCIWWVCLTHLPLASDVSHSSGPQSKLPISHVFPAMLVWNESIFVSSSFPNSHIQLVSSTDVTSLPPFSPLHCQL